MLIKKFFKICLTSKNFDFSNEYTTHKPCVKSEELLSVIGSIDLTEFRRKSINPNTFIARLSRLRKRIFEITRKK
jgi:hypothetical protein